MNTTGQFETDAGRTRPLRRWKRQNEASALAKTNASACIVSLIVSFSIPLLPLEATARMRSDARGPAAASQETGNIAAVPEGQVVDNVRYSQTSDGLVTILYDLGGSGDVAYSVEAWLSTDGGKTFPIPLKTVAGEIGAQVKPGKSKLFVWDLLADLGRATQAQAVFKIIARTASMPKGRGAPAVPQAKPPGASATAGSASAVGPLSIVREAYLAQGGDVLKAVRTIHQDGVIEVTINTSKTPIRFSSFVILPDRVWQRLNYGGVEIVTCINREVGWYNISNTTMDFPTDRVAVQQKALRIELVRLLTGWDRISWRRADDRMIDGAPCSGVSAKDLGYADLTLYIDKLTNLPRGLLISDKHGRTVSEAIFRDYTSASGIRLPSHTVSMRGDTTVVQSVEVLEVNVPVDESLFLRPR